jgi:hypothetical protein
MFFDWTTSNLEFLSAAHEKWLQENSQLHGSHLFLLTNKTARSSGDTDVRNFTNITNNWICIQPITDMKTMRNFVVISDQYNVSRFVLCDKIFKITTYFISVDNSIQSLLHLFVYWATDPVANYIFSTNAIIVIIIITTIIGAVITRMKPSTLVLNPLEKG